MEKVVFDSSNFSEINYMNFDADFKIKIKDKIKIILGPNGTGKTSIYLNIKERHQDYSYIDYNDVEQSVIGLKNKIVIGASILKLDEKYSEKDKLINEINIKDNLAKYNITNTATAKSISDSLEVLRKNHEKAILEFNNDKLNSLYSLTDEDSNFIKDNFKNIKIGDNKAYVISNIGKPSRIDYSEYNFKWYVYNEDLNKFAMVGIEEDNVVALYSNGIDSNEIDIRLNSNRDFVREKYSPLEYKKKGNTRYVINSDDQYDILDIGKNYVTVFYDIHEDNKVCGYQIISKKAESTLNGIYPQGNDRLQESFEAQTKDLVNTERTKNNLNILSYSEKATTSSRKHSEDMMIKNYFDHTNKENKSPFDRMEEEGINYKNAGENIAAGQSSAIYAHHAWMNSLGHRKNILGDYKYIGVGVIFGGYYNIYYTQNFYT